MNIEIWRRQRWRAIAGIAAAVPISAAHAEEIALTPDNWSFAGKSSGLVAYQGAPALSIYNGSAVPEGVVFENGMIEYKVSFSKERGFSGVAFRAEDEENYEHFYLRPHQSGMPDANQYTPVFYGNSGWQIYYGPRYSVPVAYPYGEWIDVKLVVSGDKADIYINSDEPVLHVADLKRDRASGAVAFDSFLTNVFVKDVRITPQENPQLSGEPAALSELPEHLVRRWRVSQVVAPLKDATDSNALRAALAAASWRPLDVEENGIANLGRVGERNNERNTILAKLTVRADRMTTKRLDFGYSDKATVWVNGAPVYAGDNTYRSRDYRYLGTVGLFDSLLVPLKEGDNEIVFAVEEAFGGWGLIAAFKDMNGIEILYEEAD